MSGAEIKQRIKAAGLNLWQVAEKYGCNDGNFSRKLRKDFTAEETERLLSIIDELQKAQKKSA